MTEAADFLDELEKRDPKAAERLRKAKLATEIASLTPAAWLAREIEAEDCLLGRTVHDHKPGMLAAETGKGKTMLCLGIAFAAHLGLPFLHWKAGRASRVLYIDGEMPRDLMQERIRLACQWYKVEPPKDGLFFLSREDFEAMPPLDSEEWQPWITAYIDALKPDFVILDNLMSLTVGNLKETDSWRFVDPWIKALTRRRVGVLLVHHLGHDKSKSYGDSTKEWALDYVILGEAVEDPDASVSLNLEFRKARRRRPETMGDFEPALVVLKNGTWSTTREHTRAAEQKRRRLNDKGKLLVQAVEKALKYEAQRPPHHDETRGVTAAVSDTVARSYWRQIIGWEEADERQKDRSRWEWKRGRENAIAAGAVRSWGEYLWLP